MFNHSFIGVPTNEPNSNNIQQDGNDILLGYSGNVILEADDIIPTLNNQVASKQYVDGAVSGAVITDHNSLQNIGINTHIQIDDHINNLNLHRQINDAQQTATNLWSANKINSELGTKESIINKDIAGGYAGLDTNSRIPLGNLTKLNTNKIWIGDLLNDPQPKTIGGGISLDNSGLVSLTNSSVTSQLLTGYIDQTGIVSTTDTIISGISKNFGNHETRTLQPAYENQVGGSAIDTTASKPTFILRDTVAGDSFIIEDGLNANARVFAVNNQGAIVKGSISQQFGDINISNSTMSCGPLNCSSLDLDNGNWTFDTLQGKLKSGANKDMCLDTSSNNNTVQLYNNGDLKLDVCPTGICIKDVITTINNNQDINLIPRGNGVLLLKGVDIETQINNNTLKVSGDGSISSHSDVNITNPANTEILQYNGSQWINTSIPSVATTLNGLTDVNITSPLLDNELIYNGAVWVNQPKFIPTLQQVYNGATFPQLSLLAGSPLQISSPTGTNNVALTILDGATTNISLSPYGEIIAQNMLLNNPTTTFNSVPNLQYCNNNFASLASETNYTGSHTFQGMEVHCNSNYMVVKSALFGNGAANLQMRNVAGSTTGYELGTGDWFNATGTYGMMSDERLKHNIFEANYNMCFDFVKNLPLKYYAWNQDYLDEIGSDDKNNLGWIAQDIEATGLKHCTRKSEVNYCNIEDLKTFDPKTVYAHTYGCVKKLIEIVEAQQIKITELEACMDICMAKSNNNENRINQNHPTI